MQNPIPYPCKDCSRANKDRFCEHKKCKAYREWLKIEWHIACKPFRELKQEQRGKTMIETVKVNWSGGKDSTCATLLHLEEGHRVKVVSYIPMFTEDIPLILKDHYNFIMETKRKFEGMGAEVHIVHGMTYWDFVTHVNIKGKNKGRIRGFACIGRGMCDFKRDSKIKALNSLDIGEYDYTDIGIAFDEIARHGQLTDTLRSILVEKEVTEDQAKERCIYENVLSPQYILGNRDGCVLCVNAKEWEREQWYKDYPGAKEKLIELQDIVKQERPDRPPLRQYKYFI